METTTLQRQRRRKFLLVAPLLVLPFLTLLFWTLGGGQASADAKPVTATGFNSHLPDAKLKASGDRSKLSFYARASADSEKYRQAVQTDPYAKTNWHPPFASPGAFAPHGSDPLGPAGAADNNPAAKTMQISQKLKQLQALVNKAATPVVTAAVSQSAMDKSLASRQDAVKSPVIATAEDPELKQMNGLLEKILDIQHPERRPEKAVVADSEAPNAAFQAIPAVVDGTQKLVQGTVVRMKLQDSACLNGQVFPEGTLIYGSGDLYNQRVKIHIQLMHVGLKLIPVDLSVYDRTDGLEGISVPEAVTGDAMKGGAVNGMQRMDLMSLDPSVTAQLTAAGLSTAKGLFSKKLKRVKGKVRDGHLLLLRDNAAQKNAR